MLCHLSQSQSSAFYRLEMIYEKLCIDVSNFTVKPALLSGQQKHTTNSARLQNCSLQRIYFRSVLTMRKCSNSKVYDAHWVKLVYYSLKWTTGTRIYILSTLISHHKHVIYNTQQCQDHTHCLNLFVGVAAIVVMTSRRSSGRRREMRT